MTIKYTSFVDGLDVFVPDEDIPELYRIVYHSPIINDMREKLMYELEKLISYPELGALKE